MTQHSVSVPEDCLSISNIYYGFNWFGAFSASFYRRGMAAESLAISCLLGILFWMLNQITLAVGVQE